MLDYLASLPTRLAHGPLATSAEGLAEQARQLVLRHGRQAEWQAALEALPQTPAGPCRLDQPSPTRQPPLAAAEQAALAEALQRFHPWRKGPFLLHGVAIDAEWRSDWKWARVAPHLAPLAGQRILDVGCGNGYYGWRMVGAGAAEVVGIDPTLIYFAQFLALRRYLGAEQFHFIPTTMEALPGELAAFDTVFSMGVLYHRRDPERHLAELYAALRPGGQLVLETLVLPPDMTGQLDPPGRYAKMKNVHAIPAVALLLQWVAAAGFVAPRCVDQVATLPGEQRATPWMRFESLSDFLDPTAPERTVEGHPAPQRAVVIATRPPLAAS